MPINNKRRRKTRKPRILQKQNQNQMVNVNLTLPIPPKRRRRTNKSMSGGNIKPDSIFQQMRLYQPPPFQQPDSRIDLILRELDALKIQAPERIRKKVDIEPDGAGGSESGLSPDSSDIIPRVIEVPETPRAYSQKAGRTQAQMEELRAYGLTRFPASYDDAERALIRKRGAVSAKKTN